MAVDGGTNIDLFLTRPQSRAHGVATGRWTGRSLSTGDASGGSHEPQLLIPLAMRQRYAFEIEQLSLSHTVVLTAAVMDVVVLTELTPSLVVCGTTVLGFARSAFPAERLLAVLGGLHNVNGGVTVLVAVEASNVDTRVIQLSASGWYYDRAIFRGGAAMDREPRE